MRRGRSLLSLGLLVAAAAAPAAACVDVPPGPKEWVAIAEVMPGGLWGVAFDQSRRVLVTNLEGVYRLGDDGAWAPLPRDGLIRPEALSIDRGGTLHVRDVGIPGAGVQALAPGATTWVRTDDGVGCVSHPVETTDGSLYMIGDSLDELGVYPVLRRAPGGTTWEPTGHELVPGQYGQMVAGEDGEVWLLENDPSTGDQHLRSIRGTTITPHGATYSSSLGLGVTLLAAEGGVVYAVSSNYVLRHGYVYAYDVASGETTVLNDGTCLGGRPGGCSTALQAEGGYIVDAARSARGDVYVLWSAQNGDVPYLLRLRRGATVWEEVETLLDVWATSSSIDMVLDGDRVYFAATLYVNGDFFGYLYEL